MTAQGVACDLGPLNVATLVTDNPRSTRVVDGMYSSAYGSVGTAQVIEMSTDVSSRGDFCTVIGKAGAGIDLIKDESGLPIWRYRDSIGEILVAQPRGEPVRMNDASYDGDWVIVIGGASAVALVAGGSSLQPSPGHRLSEMISDVGLFDVETRP